MRAFSIMSSKGIEVESSHGSNGPPKGWDARICPPSNPVAHQPFPARAQFVIDPDKPCLDNPTRMLALPDNMTAFIDLDGRSLTRKELFDRAYLVAQILKSELGLEEGDALFVADVSLTHRPEWMLAIQLCGARTIMLGKDVDPTLLLRSRRMHVKGILVGSDARYQEVLETMEESWAEAANSFSMSEPPSKPPLVVVTAVEEALQSFGSWGTVREVVTPRAPFAVWKVKTQERMEDVEERELMEAEQALKVASVEAQNLE